VAQQLLNQQIYSEARLRSLPVHQCSAVPPAQVQARLEAQEQQAILVRALDLSHNPSLHNRRQVLEREYLGQPLVSLNSSSSSNSNSNNNNNLLSSVRSGSPSSSQPQLGPAYLVRVLVVHLGSRISPPLASAVAPSGQQQVAHSVLREPLDNQPASLLQVLQAFLANPNPNLNNNLQLGAHSVVLVSTRLLNHRFSVKPLKVAQRPPALARLAINSSSSHSSHNLSHNLSSHKQVVYSAARVVAYLVSHSSSSSNLNRLDYLVPPQPNLKVAYLEVRRRGEVYSGTSKISSKPNSPLNQAGFLEPNQLLVVCLEMHLVRRARQEQSARNPKRMFSGSLQVKQRTSNQQLGRTRSAHPCLVLNLLHRGLAPRHQRVAHYLEMDNRCLV
jgi:hypothetical protein